MTKQQTNDCRACKACANYGFGCQSPLTEADLPIGVQLYVGGPNDRPDCWEREMEE